MTICKLPIAHYKEKKNLAHIPKFNNTLAYVVTDQLLPILFLLLVHLCSYVIVTIFQINCFNYK